MATLTIIPYAPKPPKGNIRKPISKSIAGQPSPLDKSFQIDSNGVPIEAPPALGGSAGGSDWCQKVIGDGETKVQDGPVSRNGLAETRASIAEKNSPDNDTDNDFLPLTYPLSPKYNHISAEERPSIKDTAKMSDNLFDSRGSRAPGSYNEPIELGSYDKLEGDGGNLDDTGHARRTVDSEQPGSGTFILEHPPTLSNRTASQHNDSDIGIDNTKPPRTAKRQRPYSSMLPHTGTPPLPHIEDGKGSRENIDHSDPDESGDGDSWSKRRKVSAPPISEDEDEDDETLSSSSNSSAASTARTPASESAPTKPQRCLQLIDANQDWEIRRVIGKEEVDGVLHYLVDWYPTLLPEHSLGHAKELVDEFEARLRAQHRAKNGRVSPCPERGERMVVQVDASGGPQQKRRRGRPRKPT